MTPPTLQHEQKPVAVSGKAADQLALLSGFGAALCVGLGAVAILAPDTVSLLTAGTAVMYDAMIWMAEICRFD